MKKQIQLLTVIAMVMAMTMTLAARNNVSVVKNLTSKSVELAKPKKTGIKFITTQVKPGITVSRPDYGSKAMPAARAMAPRNTDEKMCRVTYQVVPNDNYLPSYMELIGADNTEYEVPWYGLEADWEIDPVIEVPAGVYTAHADYRCLDFLNDLWIVKENLVINGDTTIVFDPAEANHIINVNLVNNKGNRITYDRIDPMNGDIISEGNVQTTVSTSFLFLKGFGPMVKSMAMYGTDSEDNPNPDIVFTVSPHSENIIEAYARYDVQKDGTFLCNVFSSDENTNSFLNTPENYKLISEYFQRSLAGKASGKPQTPSLACRDMIFGEILGGWDDVQVQTTLPEGAPVEIYMNSPQPSATCASIVKPQIIDNITTEHMTEQYYDEETGQIVSYDYDIDAGWMACGLYEYADANGKAVYLNLGTNDFFSTQETFSGQGAPFYMAHPQFSFLNEDKGMTYGEGTPAMMMGSFNYVDGNLKVTQWTPSYVGRLGDSFAMSDLKVDVRYNGTPIMTNTIELDTKLYTYLYSEEHTPGGKWVGTFEYPTEVDGIVGSNKAEINVDESKDDFTAPTVQILNFVTANGVITDRFENGSDGTLQMAAGDFNYQMELGGVDSKKADIIVEYTPNGSNSWTEFEGLTEVSENFVPTIGYFYTANLGEVAVESANNWYDLRITLTDEAGNSQEQVISPAFRINNILTGLGSINADGTTEVARYTVDGRTISTPQTGINIVKMSDGTVKKILVN